MRITAQLLKKHCSTPRLNEEVYLDLSENDIVAIERLGACRQLQTLVLRGNSIEALRNVDCCRQLWKIDLTGNRVKTLPGLSRFPVLGSLLLGDNVLGWAELPRLAHLSLLTLTLRGNTKLTSDPHYREHVIDLLPHLWMLDGLIITAEERKRVANFFTKSEATAQPVRRKAAERVFVPTNMRNLLVTGVFGEKTAHMMSRFPVSYVHNIAMDAKRLQYLAYTMESELRLENGRHKSPAVPIENLPRLVRLLAVRRGEEEHSNMLLLLMLAHLQYDMPLEVTMATLGVAKLTTIGDVDCKQLFLLPARLLLETASVLLSAAMVDREDRKEGGLYDDLFASLRATFEAVQGRVTATRAPRHDRTSESPPSQLKEKKMARLRCLLASEVVHLLCLVPLFFECLEDSQGLIELISVATNNRYVTEVLGSITWKVQQRGGDVWEVYHDIASFLLHSTSGNVLGRRSRQPTGPRRDAPFLHRSASQILSSTRPRPPVRSNRALSAGSVRMRSRARATRSAPLRSSTPTEKEPELGDVVLVSPGKVARIVALPEAEVAVLQLKPHPSSSSVPPDSYFYTETRDLLWDHRLNCWTNDSLVGEVSTSHLTPSPEHASMSTLPAFPSTISLESGRPWTPEPRPPSSRPHSQLSYYSDDLQTIPSEQELDELGEEEREEEREGEGERPSTPAGPLPMMLRVDISDRAPSVRGMACQTPPLNPEELADARTGHHRHVLLQYSLSQEPEAANISPSSSTPSPSSQHTSDGHSQTSAASTEPLAIPTPQVQLLATWSSAHSLPVGSHAKTHSCLGGDKRISHLDSFPASYSASAPSRPPRDPPDLASSSSSLSLRSKSSLFVYPERGPLARPVFRAWEPVHPRAATRHTTLTSSRLMSRRQQKTPSKTSTSSGLTGPGINTTVVLQQKQPRPSPSPSPSPSPVSAYASHSQLSRGRAHLPPQNTSRPPSRRRLGEVRSLYIGGTALM